jgi:tetratricopeptide (TPR) repeat protein
MSAAETDPPEVPAPPPDPEPDVTSGTAARRARQQARRAASAPVSSEPAPAPGAHRTGRELDPDALAALEEERSFLLRSLDDLEREHDAGDVDDVDYEALKDDYTARAAAVIRSIEQRHAAFGRARPPRRRSRTLAWVAALLVASVGIGIFVAQSSGRREAGESISGDIRITSRDQLLSARVAQGEGRFVDAIAIYDDVLAAQPANTEALTYKGWLLFLTSRQTEDRADTQVLVARAKELLDTALTVDPDYGDALVFRAQVLRALGLDDQALADLDALQPGSIPSDMQPIVDNLRASLGGTSTVPGTSAPTPGG